MISWLVLSFVPLTILLITLLIVKKLLAKHLSVTTLYSLWALVPLALLLNSLPSFWYVSTNKDFSDIHRYIVKPIHAVSEQLSVNWLFIVWFVGAISLCAFWLFSQWRYKKLLSLSPLSDTQSSALNTHNKLPKSLTVFQSTHSHSPMLVGLFKQVLVIPEDFEQLYNAEQQKLIIEHEICHYSRHDMWVNQLALLLLALFWFYPLAWHAYHSFRQDQEHSCDQSVLSRKHKISRVQYCKALVVAAETSPPLAFTLMSFKQNGEKDLMFNRIKQIKEMKESSSWAIALVSVLSLSLLSGVSIAGDKDKLVKAEEQHVSPIYRVEPKYPAKAAKEGVEGSVVLKFDISADGAVDNVEVVNAKPAYTFDKVATTAVAQWKYKAPGKVITNQLVQLDFAMDESSSLASLIERVEVNH